MSKHLKKDGRFFQIEETAGSLTGKTPEENLYLAYLFLAHKQYGEAYRLLSQQLSGHPLGYSEPQNELVDWLFDLIDDSEDNSSEAKGVQLKLLSLCIRNGAARLDVKERVLKTLKEGKLVSQEVARVQSSVRAYGIKLQQLHRYKMDDEQLKLMHESFKSEVAYLQTEAEENKKLILALANQLPEAPEQALVQALSVRGKKKQEIQIDDLIIMYLQNDAAALRKQNPHISQASLEMITTLLNQYMVQTTEAAYLARLEKLTKAAIEASKSSKKEALITLDGAIFTPPRRRRR